MFTKSSQSKTVRSTSSAVVASLLLFGLLTSPATWAGSWIGVGGTMQENTRTIAFGRTSGSTIWAFSGHRHYGVFKSLSTDNGATWSSWTQTSLDEVALYDLSAGETSGVNVVATHPNYMTTRLIVAGTTGGEVFRSTDNGVSWTPAAGLPGPPVTEARIAPNGDVLVSVYGAGIYRSQAPDLGQNFTLYAGVTGAGNGRFLDVELDPGYGTNGVVYATTDAGSGQSGGAYKLVGGAGGSWVNLTASLPPADTFSFSCILVVPNPAYLWLGDTKGHGLLKGTFTNPNWTWTPEPVACLNVLDLRAAPDWNTTNLHIAVGTKFGWYEGTSGVFKQRFPKGLSINSVVFDPNWSTTKIIWLATSDGVRYFGDNEFPRPADASGFSQFDISFLAASPNMLNDGTLFAASHQFGIFRSQDGGKSYVQYLPPLAQASSGANVETEITALALHPFFNSDGGCGSTSTTIYMATKGGGVYRSSAGGSDWASMNAGLNAGTELTASVIVHVPTPTSYPLFMGLATAPAVFRYNPNAGTGAWEACGTTLTGTAITALALPPNHDGTAGRNEVFVGTTTGLFRSVDGGISWTPELLPPGAGPVTAIVFSPNYDGSSSQVMYCARSGAGVLGKFHNGPGWDWFATNGTTPNILGNLAVSTLAISPNFSTDQTIFAGVNDPAVGNVANQGGVYFSTDGGTNWSARRVSLTDQHVTALALVPTASGPRLICGTKRSRAFYTDTPTVGVSAWVPCTGWSSTKGEIRTVAMSPAPTDTGCPVSGSGDGSDVFQAGDGGVFWSNDGGENFRPINQWNTAILTTGCYPPVNCLFAFMNPDGPGGSKVPTPMLLVGTNGQGVWYRYATAIPATNGWDWSQGMWQRSDLNTGIIRHFTRERSFTPLVIRAATDMGTWVSNATVTSRGENWVYTGLAGDITDIRNGQVARVQSLRTPYEPDAPGGNATWGTVSNSGVYRGTDTGGFARAPLTVTWEARNGSGAGYLENLNTSSVIELTSGTLLCGTNGAGVYRSADSGVTWWEAARTTLGGVGKPVTDFLESSNGDVLCAVNSTLSGGGVFLSGDAGDHWASISDGFDANAQSLSSIVSDSGTPPTYYAGTYSRGSYATTITALNYPTVTGLGTTSGPSTGGTAVTITGTGFLSACPSGYTCPDSSAVVVFGGLDATTAFTDSSHLSATTPAHPGGAVQVWVRNPETRTGTYAGTFTFTEVEGGAPEFKVTVTRDLSNRVVVTWENAPGAGAVRLFRSPTVDFSRRVTSVSVSGVSGSYTFTDTTGTDAYAYYYKVE